MSITVNITDNSREILDELQTKVENALNACGMTAENYAKRNTPVDTGRLRNSITYATKNTQSPANTNKHPKGQEDALPEDYKTNSTPEKGTVYIGSNVFYAAAVEFRDMSSHKTGQAHFLRDAVSQHTNEYKEIIKQALK